MKRFRVIFCLLFVAMLLRANDRSWGDEVCAVISAGAETVGPGGSYMNVGQVAIGYSNNGAITMHAGGLPCVAMHVICRLGDVNHDGLIDGDDINSFTRVKITGIGTAWELCASNLTVPQFVALLLS